MPPQGGDPLLGAEGAHPEADRVLGVEGDEIDVDRIEGRFGMLDDDDDPGGPLGDGGVRQGDPVDPGTNAGSTSGPAVPASSDVAELSTSRM